MLNPEQAMAEVQGRLQQRDGVDPPPPAPAGSVEEQLFWLGKQLATLTEHEARFGRELAVRRSGAKGRMESLAKRVIRRLLREQTRPQREFNQAVSRFLTQSLGALEAANRELLHLKSENAALRSGAAPTDTADHAAYLSRVLPTADQTLRPFLADLTEPRVAVLGCGAGVLLALLREAGVEAYGTETSPTWLAACRERGLSVQEQAPLAHLTELPLGALGGLFFAGLERHDPLTVRELLALAAARLAIGGTLVAFAANPLHEQTLRTFYRDPLRRTPLDPELLRYLAEAAGLTFLHLRLVDPGDRTAASVLALPEAAEHRAYGVVLRKLDQS